MVKIRDRKVAKVSAAGKMNAAACAFVIKKPSRAPPAKEEESWILNQPLESDVHLVRL